jgi:hypothetical protein
MTTPLDRARALLEKVSAGKLPAEPFPLNAVYRAQWSMLASQEDAFAAVTVLIEHGYMADLPGATEAGKGRPREPRYVINPEALQ